MLLNRKRLTTLLVLLPLLAACNAAPPPLVLPEPINGGGPRVDPGVRAADAVWELVQSAYVYPAILADLDWLSFANMEVAPENYSGSIEELITLLPENTVLWQDRSARVAGDLAPALGDGFAGIGALLSYRAEPKPRLIVLSVIPGGPAERAGITDHDSITHINGAPIDPDLGILMSEDILGPEGSSVELTINTPDGPFGSTRVERAFIDPNSHRRFITGFLPDSGILYMRVPRLGYDGLDINFIQAFQDAALQRTITAMVIDLRIASTGAGWPLESMLSAFADGIVGAYYTRDQEQPLEIEGINFFNSQTIPIILLVGPDTQGLPEVFAAAMQSTGRAYIMGMPTPGDVETLTPYALPDGSTLAVATLSYKDAFGNEIGLTGVIPDRIIETDWDMVSNNDDILVQTAYQALIQFR
jgi:C-terminal processing protease CtpA/Prc